jgi:hypothetical protein
VVVARSDDCPQGGAPGHPRPCGWRFRHQQVDLKESGLDRVGGLTDTTPRDRDAHPGGSGGADSIVLAGAVDGHVGVARHVGHLHPGQTGLVDLVVRPPLGQLLNGDPALHARQGRPQAAVDAVTQT